MKTLTKIIIYAIIAVSILSQDSSPDINPDDVTIKAVSVSLFYDNYSQAGSLAGGQTIYFKVRLTNII